MTNIERILDFLISTRKNLCDDCISQMCNIYPRQQVNQICNKKISSSLITKKEKCSNCNKIKLTRNVI